MGGTTRTRLGSHARVSVVVGMALAGVVTGFAVMASTTSPEPRPATLVGEPARDFALQHLRARAESVDAVYIDRRLGDLLPNRKVSIRGGAPEALAAGVVSGRISEVDAGAGYGVDGDASRGTVTDPFADDALWRVTELEIEVDDAVGAVPAGSVRVGLAMDAGVDFDNFRNGLAGQRVLLPLDGTGSFRHDRTLFGISRSGSLLGFVDDDDGVTFPVLHGGDGEEYSGNLDTVDEIFEAATRPSVVTRIARRDGLPALG